MPIRVSEHLGISRDSLEQQGVFDALIDYDSRLHIDPALLSGCRIPEFNTADGQVTNYFIDVLRLVHSSKQEGDAMWRAALKKLTFGEGLNSGLGYSRNGTNGSGIGPDTAYSILCTVKEIVDNGINDPRIFELVPIFEAKIGPDRISDMISIILKDEFVAYTTRIAGELGIDYPLDSRGKRLVFVPRCLLSDLPVAEQWEDVEISAAYNEEVREGLNDLIGKSWKKIGAELSKNDLKELLIKNPQLLRELLSKYRGRTGKGYDFELDHIGIMLWDILGFEATEQNPIDLTRFQEVTSENIFEVLMEICAQYKKLIEHNGLVEHIYDSNDDRRPERFPQLLFYAVADCYCKANRLDLNREINGGSGALDFKVSNGAAKVNLEIKYSSNPKLIEGFEKQLPAYNQAEGVAPRFSIYLILRVNNKQDHKIATIQKTIADRKAAGIESPALVVIDAIIKPSASKRT